MNPVKPVLDQLDGIIESVEKSVKVTEPEQRPTASTDTSATPASSVAPAAPDGEQAPKKKEKKKKGKGGGGKDGKPAAAPQLPPEQTQFLQCDLRVGAIKTIGPHPDASGLYALTVAYSESDSDDRSVCAGLRNFLTEDELRGRHVVTICNLKPRTVRGIASTAMILAGSVVSGGDDNEEQKKEKVCPLDPPAGCKVGDIVSVACVNGLDRTVESGKFVSGKNWDRVSARLGVKDGKACYNGEPLLVTDGPVSCDLPDGSEIH